MIGDNTNNQPRELFVKSLHHFRKILCSTKYTYEQKNKAFDGLTCDYFRCKLTEDDKMNFVSMVKEFNIRQTYELLRKANERIKEMKG